jgi:hypothetical protein
MTWNRDQRCIHPRRVILDGGRRIASRQEMRAWLDIFEGEDGSGLSEERPGAARSRHQKN